MTAPERIWIEPPTFGGSFARGGLNCSTCEIAGSTSYTLTASVEARLAAADRLAEAFKKCIDELMNEYHNERDGVWSESDFERVEAPFRAALTEWEALTPR